MVLGLFASVLSLWLFFRLPIFAGFFVACVREISWLGRRWTSQSTFSTFGWMLAAFRWTWAETASYVLMNGVELALAPSLPPSVPP